ncbi:hypothetical protein AX14_014121 [Amanita brunnescens Koide BX004]|nr:hypothetical protein AX14_014121 [Amanita brunnescens Koide BX004]
MPPRITWEDQPLPGDFNNGEEGQWVALLALKGNQVYGQNSDYRIVILKIPPRPSTSLIPLPPSLPTTTQVISSNILSVVIPRHPYQTRIKHATLLVGHLIVQGK